MAEEGENIVPLGITDDAETVIPTPTQYPTVRLRWDDEQFHYDMIAGASIPHIAATALMCEQACATVLQGGGMDYVPSEPREVRAVFDPHQHGGLPSLVIGGGVSFSDLAFGAAALRAQYEAGLRRPHIEAAAAEIQARAARSAILNA